MNPLKKLRPKLNIYPGLLSRILLVIVVIFMIGVTIWISGPLPERDETGAIITPQATATSNLPNARSRIAPDILETTPTSGVILAGLGVITIILVGTAISIKSQQ
jgi:type IV secretory pathway TrbD component